jgi:hypothetical protein
VNLSEYTEALFWIAGISLVAFVLSILLLPLVIIRLPAEFFVRKPPPPMQRSPLQVMLRVLKNALGLIFFLAGIIMLFIPGQGILSMLFGISMMDLPGKRRLESRIVRMPRVHRSLNWLRTKTERPPFILPPN